MIPERNMVKLDGRIICEIPASTVVSFDNLAGRYVFSYKEEKIFMACYLDLRGNHDMKSCLVDAVSRFSELYIEEMKLNEIIIDQNSNNSDVYYNVNEIGMVQRGLVFEGGEIAIIRGTSLCSEKKNILWVMCYARSSKEFIDNIVIPFFDSLRGK